jgi:cobaltochelatase CobS
MTATLPISSIIGYRDAVREYASTDFRETWEFGGVHLWDEFDHGNPNTLSITNDALANWEMSFPDKRVARHADNVQVAASNTNGRGPTRQYPGAMAISAATRDRFAFVYVGIDEGLERAGVLARVDNDHQDLALKFLTQVRQLRKTVEQLNLEHVFTPRACLDGADLIQEGFGLWDVANMYVRRGMSDKEWDKVLEHSGVSFK